MQWGKGDWDKLELDKYYHEAETLLQQVLFEKNIEVPKKLLHEAINLNQNLIKKEII